MPRNIFRDEVQRLIAEAGAQLVKVLPAREYEAQHLPGALHSKALEAEPTTVVEEVMDPGPSTFRPDVPLEEMQHYLKERNLDSVVITTADGQLLGNLPRAEIA